MRSEGSRSSASMPRDDSRSLTEPSRSAREIWQKYDAMERRLTRPLTDRMLDLAGLVPGMHVLDVGTGRGEPAIPAAHRVAPTGSVLGIDVSETMLQMAQERADAEHVTNLELRAQAAESLDLPSKHFDAVLARWGLMYFSSPVSAMMAMRRALMPDGVLVATLWAEPERVPYFTLPRDLLARYAAVPEIDFEAPGTFRYAHVERIYRDFAAAGLQIEHIEECEIPVMEAETVGDLITWVRAFGLERLVKDLSSEVQAAWEADLASAVTARSGGGKLHLGGVTRIVVARS